MRQKGDFPLIMDTKYKKLKEGDRKLGVSQADFYQIRRQRLIFVEIWVSRGSVIS